MSQHEFLGAIIFALAVVVILIIIRNQGKDRRADAPASSPPQQQRPMPVATVAGEKVVVEARMSLPNLGSPGTETDAQREAIDRIFPSGLPPLSHEQASIILSARDYSMALLVTLEAEGFYAQRIVAAPVLIAFIVSDEDLRMYVTKWNKGRFQRGIHHGNPRLRRNENYEKIRDYLLKFYANAID